MWFRQVLVILLLIGAAVPLGRFVAYKWPSRVGQFLTAEEFFGEDLLREIEALGIPIATHAGLMPEMYEGVGGRRPEDMSSDITYDMCTLPTDLTLHFWYREYVPDMSPTRQPRDSFVDLAEVHALEEPCSNDLIMRMVQHAPIVEPLPVGHPPTIELEIENFPRDRSRRSTYFLTLNLNFDGELVLAVIREEWQVITPWGRAIQQLNQDPDPSDGDREIGYFSFSLQVGIFY